MPVSYEPRTLYLATCNKNKFLEARSILSKHGLRLKMIEIKTIEVQHDSLETIALHALDYAIKKVKIPLLVEDSGLFVNRLSGFPGPYSSYVYRTIGVQGVLKLLKDEAERTAQFKSCVVYATPTQPPNTFLGIAKGTIPPEPRGYRGFAFDSIFSPCGSNKTFAEMPLREKNVYSHRAKALNRFIEWYLSRQG